MTVKYVATLFLLSRPNFNFQQYHGLFQGNRVRAILHILYKSRVHITSKMCICIESNDNKGGR
jgi:hypothetical protein